MAAFTGGGGATLSIDNTALALLCTSVTPRPITIEALEDSTLTTTGYKTYVPADLKEPGGLDVQFFMESDDMDTLLALVGSVQTSTDLVLTYNDAAFTTTDPTLSASGFIDSYEPGELANNQLVAGTLGIAFDGKTAPAFADGT